MKKALRDALKSVVTDERKSEVTEPDVQRGSVSRITHAAMLLKEFKEIHQLSETVKRTLTDYNTAKSNLSQTINNDGIGLLKRFLVGRTKRTFVPHATDPLKDVNPQHIRDMVLDKPHFLKHTDRISVIATPLEQKGKVGLEFFSVDPKTSTVDRARKAFKAADILLNYVGSQQKNKGEHVDGLIETLRKDIDGLYGKSRTNSDDELKKKSLLASRSNNLFIDKSDAPTASASNSRQVTGTKKRVIGSNENETIKNGSPSSEEIEKLAKKSESAIELEKEKEDEAKLKSDLKSGKKDEEISSNAAELLQNQLKQQQTLKTLKEAKLARRKYEIARHELAEKVKQLYKMANDYEKEETANQVLEVKNDHIPKAQNIDRKSEDNTHVPNTKRDDAHPGLALSGVTNHAVKGISTSTESDNGEHKAFTMGAIDKKQHQIDLDKVVERPSKSVEAKAFKAVPGKRKSTDDSLPTNLKLDELKDEVGKTMKSQEESLKVIAQAIKEDMKDIADVNKKKKMVAEAMGGAKKDKQSTDKLDEYLTKALTDIMGTDSVPGNEAGKEAEEKQKEKSLNSKNSKEENMKIVAEAMKSSNNDLPLPLLSTKGDKIVPTKNANSETGKSSQRDTNDVVQHVSDRNKGSLDMTDPANKALLDKASHLEEQVAAQQDQLYNSNGADNGPAPAKPNVEFTPSEPKSNADTVKTAATSLPSAPGGGEKKDAYGSIKETIDNPAERERAMHEDEEEEDREDGE